MRILVDLNHPAHVHLFRNAILQWREHGHKILIAARDKDVTLRLLKLYGFDFKKTGGVRKGLFALPAGVVELDWKLWRLARSFNPDVMVGTSFAIAHVSKFIRAKSIVFGEDSKEASRLFWAITQPFADAIVVPDAISDDFGVGQVKYPSYHELAYLHPKRFSMDRSVLGEEGISPNEPFSLVRFVSLNASHDFKQSGLNGGVRTKLLELLEARGRVIINTEAELPAELERLRMRISFDKLHHLLAFAQILVSDSQTMSIEAAMLGTPSVRYNSFVGRTPVIEQLEHKYQLTYGFRPSQEEDMLYKVADILSMSEGNKVWQQRRQNMLKDKLDLTDWMVDFVEGIGNKNAYKSGR